MSSPDHNPTANLVCHTWFERDRQNVRLETVGGQVIFDLWDEDVSEAVRDGFLETPRHPRPSDEQWLPCAIAYAKDMGLLQPDGSLPEPKPASRIAKP